MAKKVGKKHKKAKIMRAKRKAQPVARMQKQEAGVKKPVASIEFCDKCSSIMVPIKKGKHAYLKCRRCGSAKKREVKVLKIMEAARHQKGVTILEQDTTPLPMVEQKCEQCSNTHAYFWLQQTRAADEPPTQFFRCTKCSFTWREYK